MTCVIAYSAAVAAADTDTDVNPFSASRRNNYTSRLIILLHFYNSVNDASSLYQPSNKFLYPIMLI